MKNIETPLTWGLGILALVLIILSSLNTTSTDFKISNVNSDANNGFDLNHDHEIQEASVYNLGDWGKNSCSSSFTIKDPNMGMAAMSAESDTILMEVSESDTLIIIEVSEENSEE